MNETHPLEPLTADEIAAVAKLVLADGRAGERPAIAYVTLAEPPKDAVLAWTAGAGTIVARQAFVSLIDRASGASFEAVVEVGPGGAAGDIVRFDKLDGLHAPIVFDEFTDSQCVVSDPMVWAALQRRGVTDPATVVVEPWPAANFEESYDDPTRRLGRCVFYVREHDLDMVWSRPVQGLVAVADRGTGEVVHLIDEGDVPIPTNPGRFDAESVAAELGALRSDLKPLDIVQSAGPSFTLDGHELSWQRWRMRVSMHPIEGLVLHQVSYTDPAGHGGSEERSIIYRAAMAEMVVPYGDPQGQHFWRHVFDEGEIGMGRSANSLELGCDCLGEIRYLDAPMALGDGSVMNVANAICIHEEDQNALWRHNDRLAAKTEVRRNRRLVISYWATLGNYDYGYFWYFGMDGSIELEVKLTGVVLAGATRPEDPHSVYGARMTPTLEGPHHQHFFSFRLDMDIDGTDNTVEEIDLVADPVGPGNEHGNGWHHEVTVLGTEHGAIRDASSATGRTWRVVNRNRTNAVGQPTGYQVVLGAPPKLLAHPDSAAAKRARFAQHHLWVTPHDPAEMRAAGDYPNQHVGEAGLPAFTAADRPIEDTDVVLWVTCGSNHVARPEDWPVMPVEHAGFKLRPHGFFDRNPALDVAPQGQINGHTGH